MNVAGGTNTLSKNICTKYEEAINGGNQLETVTMDFTYNGENYPTQCVMNEILSHGSYQQYELTRERVIETATYEYLD